jgi:hypothetical protein
MVELAQIVVKAEAIDLQPIVSLRYNARGLGKE